MKFLSIILLFTLSFATQAMDIKIKKHKGEVWVGNKIVLKPMVLKEGQILEVKGKQSFAHIVFDDGSQILMKEGKLLIKKSSYKKDNDDCILDLIKGTLFSYINPKKKRSYKFKTKLVSMGIRGTKFMLKSERKKDYICVCKGIVEVKRGDQLLSLKKDEDLHVSSKNNLKSAKANKDMINMTIMGFKQMGLEI